MAHADNQWLLVRAYFEAGLSLSQIIDRDNVSIKSKSQISKRARVEGWGKSKNAPLINQEVNAKQSIAAIKKQKETIKETEGEASVSVINELVEERTKHLTFFTNSALKNQSIANRLLNEAETMQEIMHHSALTARNKDTVLGKQPDTAIQINNQQTVGKDTITTVDPIEAAKRYQEIMSGNGV